MLSMLFFSIADGITLIFFQAETIRAPSISAFIFKNFNFMVDSIKNNENIKENTSLL